MESILSDFIPRATIPKDSSNYFAFSFGHEYSDLSPLFSMVCVMILENCSEELDLVNSPYRRVTPMCKDQIVTYITPERRFGFSDEAILEENMKISLSPAPSEFARLVQVLSLLKHILRTVVLDLIQNRTFRSLRNAVGDLQQMISDELDVLETYKSNCRLHNKLTEELANEKTSLMESIKLVDESIFQAKGQTEAYLQEAGVKYFTLLSWESSRREQNTHLHNIKETTTYKIIEEKKNSTDDEKVAHEQLVVFYKEHIEDLRADILKWMVKYDEDLDSKEMNILKMRIDVEELQGKIKDLKETMEEHKREMEEWLEYKVLQKLKEHRLAIMMCAAVVIQRWWRRILEARRIAAREAKRMQRKLLKKQKQKGR